MDNVYSFDSCIKRLAYVMKNFPLRIFLTFMSCISTVIGRLCGLVIRVPGYRSRGPSSIPGATTFSEK
jgi:hypothetical protein